MYRMARPFFLSQEKGLQTAIYLASSPEVEGITGRYYIKKKPVKPSLDSNNADIARRLWDASASQTHLNTPML